ncbi:DUF6752 domain-containing protein [Nocardioides caldifontis]|uniref:DUF6752 domain-containing protein n=1 Tax=Nocardioides caldifontis TaxID=2588938 RepID=UPI0011DF94C3|nr:DUF6752 domain-containing protein [Nocardioides caldifontis]
MSTAAKRVAGARRRLARALGGAPEPAPAPRPAPVGGPAGQRALRQVAALRKRVDRLEAELQETRQLNRRLAEVTDVVAELLLPGEGRDEERLRAALEDYDRGI